MKSMLVIGLGRFGKHLAKELTKLGNDVMVVDIKEEPVKDLISIVTAAQIGDCMDEAVLKSLGINNFDVCFVCISNNFQASLEITSLLKEMSAAKVVSRAGRDIQAKFLLRNGADDVIYPERDMAQRAAVKYSAYNAFDYIELTPEYAIFEIETPKAWVGHKIGDVNVRSKYNVNIIGYKSADKITPMTSADHVFSEGQHLIIAANKKDAKLLFEKGKANKFIR